MKRIVLMLVIVLMLIPLYSCSTEFTFRGSSFGDSMQQVKQAEGDGAEIGEDGDYISLDYQNEIYEGLAGNLTYYFKDDKLELILGTYFDIHNENREHVEDVYRKIKGMFLKYGNPTKQESLEYTMYQALWKRDGYGIAFIVMDNAIIIVCSSDPAKAEGFYSTYMYSGLFSDYESSADTYTQVIGPDFYNDPYEISSFLPIPEEGYDYTVRDSINEEELSIFKNDPSLHQLISAFGYPPMAEIYPDSVMVNGELKNAKVYYLTYLVDGIFLRVKYDEGCNLIKVHYDKNLTGIPEAGNLNIEKPIGVVRNDITRDELSFINGRTKPEELQDILGAPHRECYNGELFRRMGHRFIRFFMSGHFLYPLKDGGVLDVHYTKASGGLHVASACIYEDNGERTVLVGR